MRDISFRVWDRKDKVFWMPRYGGFGFDAYYHSKKSEWKYLSELMGTDSEDFEGENRFIAQQYTGLLDKNTKAIFEGDIIERVKIAYIEDERNRNFDEISCAKIIWDNNESRFGVVYFRYKEMRQDKTWQIGDSEICPLNKEWTQEMKVIGNIFENPKLLKC